MKTGLRIEMGVWEACLFVKTSMVFWSSSFGSENDGIHELCGSFESKTIKEISIHLWGCLDVENLLMFERPSFFAGLFWSPNSWLKSSSLPNAET